jgi:3-deoxy-D-manno-octulosonic-acid transferase
MRLAYRILTYLAAPFAFAYFLWRSRREPAYRRDWAQRLGYPPPTVPRGAVWVHAASIGEVQAIAPVLDDLLNHPESPPLLVTTMTPAGRERLRERFGERVHHSYLPLDLPGAVRRFLVRTQPQLGMMVEMELWPELLDQARDQGVTMTLVNARLSARTARGYERVAGLFSRALASFDWIAAQTQADADRLVALGTPGERIEITGNLKFDQPVTADQVREGERLRDALGPERAIWAAASTREGEEAIALAAHAHVRTVMPDAALVLVPRHPQRFQAVAQLIREAGWPMDQRSADAPSSATAVFLGDSMGEMGVYIAAADVVFMGGSLVELGGQNLLEPAALERPVITGPSRFNFAAVAELLEQAGALTTVQNADELGVAVMRLLLDRNERQRMADAALACVRANQGARQAIVERLSGRLNTNRCV